MLHTVFAALILTLLVFVLGVECVFHLFIKLAKLLIVANGVGFQRVVYFLALINRELLDVLDFPISSYSFDNAKYDKKNLLVDIFEL